MDYSSQRTIHNLVMQYDLYCASDHFFSLISSCFLIGTFVGSMFLPKLADVYGRKPIFIVGLVLHLMAVTGIIISTNKHLLLVLMFMCGLSEVGRYYVGYVYAVEILPKRFANQAGLSIFIGMSMTKIFICVCYISSVQLVPTIFAASVFGVCNVSARTITILSPMVAEIDYPVPLIVIMSACGIAMIASNFLI